MSLLKHLEKRFQDEDEAKRKAREVDKGKKQETAEDSAGVLQIGVTSESGGSKGPNDVGSPLVLGSG